MNQDLKKAYEHFKKVGPVYSALFDYYDGNQPLRYSTQRLKDAFEQTDVKFRQNWCAVVVNSVLDRMDLYGWSVADEAAAAALQEVWMENRLDLESAEIHESALVTGEAFLVADRNEAGGIELYHNDPRRAAVFYDDDRPRVKAFAAKWWDSPDGARMTLYYPETIEHYIAPGRTFREVTAEAGGAGAFALDSDLSGVNLFGMIPVFHFRNSLRAAKSELKNVTELQDAINKLLCDMMVTAEFCAFPARYVISNADIAELRNSPNQIWDLPGGADGQQSTQVGTLQAADLGNYSDQIDRLASSIAIISSTPKHYFVSSNSAISGEALLTMESPLVKKVLHRRELYGDTWAEVGAFAAAALGFDIRKSEIGIQWAKAEADQPLTETEIIKNYIAAGFPFRSALRLNGYTESEIQMIQEEYQQEQQDRGSIGALLLQNALDQDSTAAE